MSKIFCELCGSAYPDTAKQCPICGSPKPASAEFSVSAEEIASSQTPRTPVKGGRFSKDNVNKRLSAEPQGEPKPQPKAQPRPKPRPQAQPQAQRAAASRSRKKKANTSKAERTLIIVIICLLVAIAAVMAYILLNYFIPQSPSQSNDPKPTETQQPPTESTAAPTTEPQEVPCTGLSLTEESIHFNAVGSTWLLNVVPTPANTTDEVIYTSSDLNVATVSADGKVTAVGSGSCTITISCGAFSITCDVTCEPPEETTAPTETEPEETKPKYTFKFATRFLDGVTLYVGDLWLAYEGEIDMADIQWSSDNTAIIRVKDGVVYAVAPGTTILRAVYAGEEFTLQITVLKAN